jgi:proline iminopeptidase
MFVETNGNRLYHEELGAENEQAILCFHGAPGLGDHREPKGSWGRLADRYRVVVQDQRGSGLSGLNPPFTHKQWIDDAEALRQYLGLGQVVVAGGSYGGFLSQEYVLAYPENVLAVMLRDTSADHEWEEQAEANALASARVKDTLDLEKYRRIMAGKCLSDKDMRDCFAEIQPLYNVNWDPVKDAERLRSIHFHHATHNYAFRYNLPGWDLKPRLGEIRVPVLVTHGRHDWIVPLEAAEQLACRIPDAQLVVFENSGHSPQIEEVELWQAAVRRFLVAQGL